MFWWALLTYVLLSPVLGLVIGGAIRMQGSGSGASAAERRPQEAGCPSVAEERTGLVLSGV